MAWVSQQQWNSSVILNNVKGTLKREEKTRFRNAMALQCTFLLFEATQSDGIFFIVIKELPRYPLQKNCIEDCIIVKMPRDPFCTPYSFITPRQTSIQGYWMVPFNLNVLAKFGLCSNCSQKLDECSFVRARKIFANARMLGFSSKFPAVNCILETRTDTGNNVSGNMRAPWILREKCFLVLLTFYWNWPARVQSQVVGQPNRKHFACNGGLSLIFLRGNLLACKQCLRKVQIPFSVQPLTLVKLRKVIFYIKKFVLNKA